MSNRIDIPEEGVTVTATCSRCRRPLARVGGNVSWRCDTYGCATRIVPMFEDARFVDDTGRQWIMTDDGEEDTGWIDVVEDFPT